MNLLDTKNIVKQTFVFTITQHPHLGVLLEPYVVNLTQTNEFSLTFRRINVTTLQDYGFILSDTEIELINIMEDFTEENIIKAFNKQALKPKEFFTKLSSDIFNDVIRPYIDKRIVKCLDIIRKKNLKIHFKGLKKDPISDIPVIFSEEPAKAVFNFIKANDKTKYFITVNYQEKTINLTNKNAVLISNKPCWLLLGNKIYNFSDDLDSKKLIPFFTKLYIEIPAKNEKQYFESFILNSVKNFNVNAQGFNIKEEDPEKTTFLKFEQNWMNGPALILCFLYGEKVFFAHEKQESSVSLKVENNEYSFVKICRDKQWEKERKQELLQMGLINIEGAVYLLPNGNHKDNFDLRKIELLGWINKNETILKEKEIEIIQDDFRERYFTGEIELEFKITQVNDWFDVYAIVKFGKFEIPFTHLKSNILNGKREYQLPNGEFAILPEEWFSRFKNILRFGKNKEGYIQLKKHHFPLIDEIDQSKGFIKELEKFKRLTDVKKLKIAKLPDGLKANLRPYQIEGFSWMSHLKEQSLGGCLADDMGLGKTIQVLTLLLDSKKNNDEIISESNQITKQLNVEKGQLILPQLLEPLNDVARTSLIVMPLSLIHNWEKEIEKFTPQLKIFKHLGINRVQDCSVFKNYDVVLTTYGIIRNDRELLKNFNFFYAVLDESQVIKNPDSKTFRAIKDLNAKHRIILTGTPIENSLNDLWSQMSFLNDGLLGSFGFYKNHFVNPIEKSHDAEKQRELQHIIQPFILRRTKQSVAKDLPALTIKVYYCEMEEEQRRIYEEHKSAIRNVILENLEKQGRDKSNFMILNGLMKLRLLANHPFLIDDQYNNESGKFNEIIQNIEKLMSENHKVLIFSSFVKHLKIFKKYFDEKDINYSILTGETNENERRLIIHEFQSNPEIKIFLISIKAGGVGLNLTSADYVFILDPWWNPAVENQAINRTHRIGQKKQILAYKFISKDSIEEKILKLQQEKLVLSNEFINEKNLVKNFSDDEIKMLLT